MATTVTYTATMATKVVSQTENYRTGRAWQGFQRYADQNTVGIVAFPDMNLTGKLIQSVTVRVTTDASGRHDKTAYLYQATAQATSSQTFDDSLTGLQYVGTSIGSFQNDMYNNTTTNVLDGTTLDNMAAYLQAGNNTFVLYEANAQKSPYGEHSVSFMVWTACSIIITYEEGASVPTTSASSVNMGASVTINTNPIGSGKTHTLKYTFGNTSETIATGVGASTTWTPPLSLASQIPSATSGLCTITCETFYNSVSVGKKTCTLTLNVPASVKPTVTISSHAEANSTVADKDIGAYVQGKSLLAVTAAAAKAYGSAIQRYVMTLEGINYTVSSSALSATMTATRAFTGTGTVTATISVTDARGRTGTATVEVTVLAYSSPSITKFTAERCNSDGTAAQVDGERIRVTAKGSVSPLTVGDTSKNTITCRVWHKLTSATAWSQGDALTASNYTLNQTNKLLTQTFSALDSYNLKLIITDIFESVEVAIDISTKQVVMDVRSSGNGIAFGKVSETDGVAEFAWPIKIGNGSAFKVAYGYVTVNSTDGMTINYSSTGFTNKPMIALGYWTSGSNTTLPEYAPRVVSVTATGAKICGKTGWTVSWIAIGV